MVNLKCDACHCIHNSDKYCCRGSIQVEGHQADEPDETCCSSFYERKDGETRNSYESPDKNIIVDCEATTCIYNEARMCVAEKIGIGGSDALSASETRCATFAPRS